MFEPIVHPATIDGRDQANVRGDPIDGQRYFSQEFARLEWDRMWTRIWHVAGRLHDLEEPGDYLVHDFMSESVIVVKQTDGSLRAFYNSCGHRGSASPGMTHPCRTASTAPTTVGSGAWTAYWSARRTMTPTFLRVTHAES